MSDERVRELQRRWQETGTVEDEVTYLLERLRVGALTKDQVGLAAHLGHPAARLALGLEATRDSTQDIQDWVLGMEAFSPDRVTCARLGLAIAWAWLPPYQTRFPSVQGARSSLQVFEEWVLEPTEINRERSLLTPSPALVEVLWSEESLRYVEVITQLSELSDEQVREAAARELVPWLLGYEDPVSKRAAKRV